jgi:outer membrane protein assembly factor BamB
VGEYASIALDSCNNSHISYFDFSNYDLKYAFLGYNVTVQAYCYNEETPVSVSITVDGSPTGYNTPHTFTDLTGTHTFTVPTTDSHGHPFKQWNTGETNTTIIVTTCGAYTAFYEYEVNPLWWPMFHHDQSHTGYSTSTAPNTNSTIWSFTTDGHVYSSPAVAYGRVYVGSWDNKVYCLDASTGAHLWNYTTGGYVSWSSPAIAEGKVYVGSDDHNVYCLKATTGIPVWNFTTGGGVSSSPAVAYGRVYVGSWDAKVYCLNATTGTHIWNFTAGGGVFSSPAVAQDRVYVASTWQPHKVYCLNATTGTHIWNYTTGDWIDSSPAVAYGKVYIGSEEANMVHALNASTGVLVWNYTTGPDGTYCSAAVAYGKVFIGSKDGKVYALNASTGTHIWNYTTGGGVISSPAVADGKVYVGSDDYKVYCLNASTGLRIWDYKTGWYVDSSPAVAYGKVYVGSGDGKIYAFGEHDVAVTDIHTVCCKDYSVRINKTVVCHNHTTCVNVTVTNEGHSNETTSVALWAQNTSTIQIGTTMPITLGAGESKTVTFLFNSTSLPKRNYTIFANATTVENETDMQDNTCVYGWIFVVHPGDLDCDGHVFLYDLTILGTAWDSRPGDDTWCANADIDGDCHVFLYDLTILGFHWDEYG